MRQYALMAINVRPPPPVRPAAFSCCRTVYCEERQDGKATRQPVISARISGKKVKRRRLAIDEDQRWLPEQVYQFCSIGDDARRRRQVR
jgi:hypothetical protein